MLKNNRRGCLIVVFVAAGLLPGLFGKVAEPALYK